VPYENCNEKRVDVHECADSGAAAAVIIMTENDRNDCEGTLAVADERTNDGESVETHSEV
jgi:hypothetical protein